MADEETFAEENSTDYSNKTLDSFYFYKEEQFAVLWLLFVVIVVGNSSVLYNLLMGRSRKSRMNYFIRHLAFADLSVGLISVLTDIIWRITVSWYAGNIACKIIKFLQVVVTYASTYVLVALSIDRYNAIRHPMKFSGSWRRAKCLIFTAWAFSSILSLPILVLYEEKVIQGQTQCWIEFSHQWKWKIYMTAVSISLFIIPASIIASCYTVIIVIIWTKSSKSFTKIKRQGSDSKRVSSRGLIPRAKIKTVKITLVIVTVFILCWSPYIIFDLLQVYGYIEQTQTNIAIATFVQSLAPLNSAANPIIYFIFSTHLCSSLRNLSPFKWFSRKLKKSNDSTTNTQSSSLSEFLTNNTSHTKKKTVQITNNAQTTCCSASIVLVH